MCIYMAQHLNYNTVQRFKVIFIVDLIKNATFLLQLFNYHFLFE